MIFFLQSNENLFLILTQTKTCFSFFFVPARVGRRLDLHVGLQKGQNRFLTIAWIIKKKKKGPQNTIFVQK